MITILHLDGWLDAQSVDLEPHRPFSPRDRPEADKREVVGLGLATRELPHLPEDRLADRGGAAGRLLEDPPEPRMLAGIEQFIAVVASIGDAVGVEDHDVARAECTSTCRTRRLAGFRGEGTRSPANPLDPPAGRAEEPGRMAGRTDVRPAVPGSERQS